jgi:cellulose biosynthesis protein BcsQ
MKTIVFHSYKGGVGRSLALTNLAFALSKLKKKVVVLDLDVDAPGLGSKLRVPAGSRETGEREMIDGGYVDYLAYFFGLIRERPKDAKDRNVDHQPEPANVSRRRKYLEQFIINVSQDGKIHEKETAGIRKIKSHECFLKFIPAGTTNQKYWWNLASPWFHQLFSISRNEYSRNGTIRLHSRRDFFKAELDVIKGLFDGGSDYFLVDCKSAREYSSVPLYYWADRIVSMFPNNDEGIKGAARVQAFVQSVRQPEENVAIIPVACRFPGDFEGLQKVRDDYYALVDKYMNELYPNGSEKSGVFCTFREFRELETNERILTLDDDLANGDPWYHRLKKDYVDLYVNLFSSGETAVVNDRTIALSNTSDWKSILKMKDLMEVDDGSYVIKPRQGTVENKDNERNVLLRATTLNTLINTMAKGLKEAADGTLKTVGSDIGSTFAWEFADKFLTKGDTFEHKLGKWCNYDSQNAGFGILQPAYDAKEEKVSIKWDYSFLGQMPEDSDSEDPKRGLDKEEMHERLKHGRSLAQGYITGVIKVLAAWDGRVDKTERAAREEASPKIQLLFDPQQQPELDTFVFTIVRADGADSPSAS